MDMNTPLHFWPNLDMIAETLPGSLCFSNDRNECYRDIRLYMDQNALQQDILYLTQPDSGFPTDQYAYLSTQSMPGKAAHILCPGGDRERILSVLLELFSQCREQEAILDRLVYQNASLQELCEAGAEMLDNPVYIHDDWFMMLARSAQVDQYVSPEYLMSSTVGYVPRVITDDFQYDSDYLETYTHRNAQIWSSGGNIPRCMYVNLWEGTVYRGRLLVIETNHPFRPGDAALAEVLTQRAMLLMQRKALGEHQNNRSMDDVVYSLLQGSQPDPAELNQLLGMLNWNKEDRFTIIRTQSQQSSVTAVMEHMIHSDLFHSFPGCYILFQGHQQCVILNLTQQSSTLSNLRHTLAPLCRDYCLYAGISSPVSSIRELSIAYHQAHIALNQAFQQRNEKWIIPFSDCALDRLLGDLQKPLQPGHLISPELMFLLYHDQEHGTEYFATFREYLLQERDIPKTAQSLIIHRTTLLYRLKKIQSLIHVNLDDPWQRLYLHMSLWILEQEGLA